MYAHKQGFKIPPFPNILGLFKTIKTFSISRAANLALGAIIR